MTHRFRSRQFLYFILTGGIAAAINFVSRIFFNQWFDFSWSIVLAYLVGMAAAYILAALFVFKESQQPVYRSIIFFVAVNGLAVLQTWVVSMGLLYFVLPFVGITSFRSEISHAIGIAVPVFTSYLGHKHWSFRES